MMYPGRNDFRFHGGPRMTHDLSADAVSALISASESACTATNSEDALDVIAQGAKSALNVEACSIITLDSQRRKLGFAASAGNGAERLRAVAFDADLGIAGHVLRTGAAEMVNDVQHNPHFYPGIDNKTSVRSDSLMCIPIRQGRNVVGVFESLNRFDGGPFTYRELHLLQVFSNLAALSLNAVQSITQSPYAFTLTGEMWEIRYAHDGHSERGRFSKRGAKGFGYYHRLLSQPYCDIAAIELQAEADQYIGSPNDLRRQHRASFQAASDRQAMQSVFHRITETRSGIEAAQASGDACEAQVMKNELEHLIQYVRDAVGQGGKLRSVGPSDPQRNAREAVRNALKRTVQQIKPTMPALAAHLNESVRTHGCCFAYVPSTQVSWEM